MTAPVPPLSAEEHAPARKPRVSDFPMDDTEVDWLLAHMDEARPGQVGRLCMQLQAARAALSASQERERAARREGWESGRDAAADVFDESEKLIRKAIRALTPPDDPFEAWEAQEAEKRRALSASQERERAAERRGWEAGRDAAADAVMSMPPTILTFWDRPGGAPGNGHRATTFADAAARVLTLTPLEFTP